MKTRRAVLEGAILLCIVLVGGLIRSFAYGDMRLSVGNGETRGYISSSTSPLWSWKAFAGKRLFTTNLIYKLADNPRQCKLTAISYPAGGQEVPPALQPCFENIALLQNLLGIFGWCYLAWTTARWMRYFPARVGVALLILFFGFTPQIAEWDSLLSPESLSLTLFIIVTALLQDIVFRVLHGRNAHDNHQNTALVVGWFILFSLWIFIRDVHLYTIPVTLVFTAALLISKDARRSKTLLTSIGLLAALFILGYTSAQASQRATHYPLLHSFEDYVLPYPTRVEFFKRFGMPDSTSPAYQHWMDLNGTRTYTAFLISHPGFVASTLWANLYDFRAQFVQPYFKPVDSGNRTAVLQLGEIVHPETMAVYLIDILCIIGLFIGAWKSSLPSIRGWAWLSAWIFACSTVTLLASFFGDANGFRRHLLPSVEPFRLLLWLLLFVYLDEAIGSFAPLRDEVASSSEPPAPGHIQPSEAGASHGEALSS